MDQLERMALWEHKDEATRQDSTNFQDLGYSWVPDEATQAQMQQMATSFKDLSSVHDRLDKLDQRLERFEDGLNRLLTMFGHPPIEKSELGATVAPVTQQTAATGDESMLNHASSTANEYGCNSSTLEAVSGAQSSSNQDAHSAWSSTTAYPQTEADGPGYPYKPLDTMKSQIRILLLHPAKTWNESIKAELKTISLDDPHLLSYSSYSALSYTWGAPVFDGSIKLNGCDFSVTKNLEAALRHMRSEASHGDMQANHFAAQLAMTNCTIWWIDQICINQTDVDERNEQVSLMRRIYKNASAVHVWLGEEENDSSTAMDMLQKLGAPPTHAPGEKAITYPKFDEDEVAKHWRALVALFQRPWWERVWIRQEVALSNVVTLMCGQKSVSMDVLSSALTALEYIERLGHRMPDFSPSSSIISWTYHPNQLTELRRNTNAGYSWVELERLLPNARACKATDARDTVFSVLGLADPEVYPMYANYRSDLKDVLLAATRAVLTKENGLDILGACQNPEKQHNLPSWVPNLSEPWKAPPFKTCKSGRSHMSELSVTDSDFAKAENDGECLQLRGALVDSVALLCDVVVPSGNDVSPETLDAVYDAWKAFLVGAWQAKHLHEWEHYTYLYEDGPEQVERNWIQFVTVMQDDAREDRSLKWNKKKNKKGHGTLEREVNTNEIIQAIEQELYSATAHYHLNFKLVRCYLLPSASTTTPSHLDVRLHPNRRIHAGLLSNGPGRRLAITSRGYIALVPAETEAGDSIALFQGASFPYVLRKYGGKKRHVLVGEAFMPVFASRQGERLAQDEFRKGLDAVIRLY